jgi:metal-responsive CopG/Arc/MetJ family transcriptional regulator
MSNRKNQDGNTMKTLKISDDVHQKLTSLLGELMAQTSKMQTYQDAIEAMLSRSVILPPELLEDIESFMEKNKHLGFTTREEFIRDAARWRLKFLREDFEYLEIPREKYERLEAAVKEMNTPYHSASDLVHKQIDEVLEKYDAWLQEKEEHEKRQRKRG